MMRAMTSISSSSPRPVQVPSSTPATPAAKPAASTATTAPAAVAAPVDGFTASAAQAAAAVGPATPTPTEVATAFYSAFAKQDLGAMGAQYAPGATFKDPIFQLSGKDSVMGMWKGLFGAGKDLKVNFQVLSSTGSTVKVAWQADYKLNGRAVHNESATTLQVSGGKITGQQDDWSWSKWAKQAFPLGGLVDFPPVKAGLLWVMNKVIG
jgi:ketosteroid isomerase-like protein